MTSRPVAGKCTRCADRGGSAFVADFTIALQPIFEVASGLPFAQEALIRGLDGGGASTILAEVTEDNRYNFDQKCRVKAIETAAARGLDGRLSINFMPNAVYEPRACIQQTIWAADKVDFPLDRLIFEFTEHEQVRDNGHLKNIIAEYKEFGFLTALDDFGAGFCGLGLLADVVPDLLKIDMELIRNVDQDRNRQILVTSILQMSEDLGIQVIAEGVETAGELDCLISLGVQLVQGYLLGRPSMKDIMVEPSVPIFPAAAVSVSQGMAG